MKESKIRNIYSALFTAFKQVRSTGVRKTEKCTGKCRNKFMTTT
jgi:hypothetical protein